VERGTGSSSGFVENVESVEKRNLGYGSFRHAMYLDDDMLTWAKAMGDHENSSDVDLHRDCNGAILQTGDSIVLTKSLDVKGSSLNAKMGTVVKNIKLVADNTEQIEGKIEGQQIVILTKFVRKSN
jgi:protein PhnA